MKAVKMSKECISDKSSDDYGWKIPTKNDEKELIKFLKKNKLYKHTRLLFVGGKRII